MAIPGAEDRGLGLALATDLSEADWIGIAWALAAHAVLVAGARRTGRRGGQDVLYTGFNMSLAREFVDRCGEWTGALGQAAEAGRGAL